MSPKKQAQLVFPALPFGHARQNLKPAEVALVLGVTDQQVRDLIDAGLLAAVAIGDGGSQISNLKSEIRRREHVRIHRPSVEALWLERYLEKNGVEYPVAQSPEVQHYRQLLAARRNKS